VKLALTHEEIAQMIGTSRETVTRLFADLKKRQIVQAKGSTLVIRNKMALKALATNT
jgi:CRP/FNR family transcriptional regulator